MDGLTGVNHIIDSSHAGHVKSPGRTGLHETGPEKLMEECREFESVLLNCMLKSMRRTVPKNSLFSGGKAEEIYTSLLDEQYALILSKTAGSGIADELYRQMKSGGDSGVIRSKPEDKLF